MEVSQLQRISGTLRDPIFDVPSFPAATLTTTHPYRCIGADAMNSLSRQCIAGSKTLPILPAAAFELEFGRRPSEAYLPGSRPS